jgi:predicted RNA-binding Zn ribbon-like protein
MRTTAKAMDTLHLLGGSACLDFVNTVDWRDSEAPTDDLPNYAAVVAWSRRAGALSDRDGARLLVAAARRPEEAAATFRRAIELREAIYRLVLAATTGLSPAPRDAAILNRALRDALAHLRIVATGSMYAWDWADDEHALDRMLWPVAYTAASLLTSAELHRVRKCAGARCGWLFLDTSKNQSRRWCNMQSCGNRAKARRHYHRRHTDGASRT